MTTTADETPASRDLLAALANVDRFGHLCFSHSTFQEKLGACIPFIRTGMQRREHCIYVTEDEARASLVDALRSEGIAASETPDAEVSVWTPEELHDRAGDVDPERMLAWVGDRAQAATRAGYTAFRFVGETIAVFGGAPLGVQRLAEFESKLNDTLPTESASALCLYDRLRYPSHIIRQLIATHPLVMVGPTVCQNPFFVPPEEYLSPAWPERELEWILESLRRLEHTQAELHQSVRRSRALARRVLEAQEVERRALARELHDALGQILVGIKLSLNVLARARGKTRVEALAHCGTLTDEAIGLTRNLAVDLRPTILDERGLAEALRWYVQQRAKLGGFSVRLNVASLEHARLAAFVETACFRLVQEAFTNILRHSGAQHVDVAVDLVGNAVEIMIRDDGRGFDVGAARERAAAAGSLGLVNMKERVALVGGQLTIESTPGRGTTIRARMPVSGDEATS